MVQLEEAHMFLNLDVLETPDQAFIRKMREEERRS